MRITATAPTRIDLAGGTLDLYPIYLFEGGGLTVNCAIDTYCTVTMESRSDAEIRLASIDLGVEERYDSFDSIAADGALEIAARAVRFFRPATGLNVTTENRVRKGSGLGASSSLLVAVLGTLNMMAGERYSPEKLIDIACNLETQLIRVPAGKQDYFAAMFGGVSALWFEVAGDRRERLLSGEADIAELQSRLILSYAGEPRFSGATNWNMTKNYIDGDPNAVAGMRRINETAAAMRACLLERNWGEFASLVDREWQNRRTLAEGVTNETVEGIMRAARDAGALANKLCGAGGGGCMITCIEPDDRPGVEAALAAAGAEVLPFKIVSEGIRLQRTS